MPPRRAPDLTGRLLVVLTPQAVHEIAHQAAAPHATDLSDLSQLEGPVFSGIQLLLGRYQATATRGVRSLTIPQILKLDADAAEGPFRPARSLLAYWIVSPGPGIALHGVVAAFRATPGVLAAVEQEAVGRPPCAWTNNQYAAQQFHLDPAPTGIDAKSAWQRGAKGRGIAFTDVEMGWNRNHEDLTAKTRKPLLTHKNDPTWEDHGTSALGLVVATDNSTGVVGIAPGVTKVRLASHWDGTSAENVADAIATSAANMDAGDVMLLETQRSDEAPIELLDGEFELDAICAATSKGITVIEPAGNGGFTLDRDFPAGRRDSGAIVVGASVGDPPAKGLSGGAHARLGKSNYGSRVDCFAPGAGLVTAGGGDLDASGDPNRSYTSAFRDTSGASAVVAGAAILAQHLHVKAKQARLDAAGMRSLLVRTGRPRALQDGPIGVMPDLAQVAAELFSPAGGPA